MTKHIDGFKTPAEIMKDSTQMASKTEPNGILDRLLEVDKQVDATMQLVNELKTKLAESYQRNAHAQKIANDALTTKNAAIEIMRRKTVEKVFEILSDYENDSVSDEWNECALAIRGDLAKAFPEYC